MKNMPFNVVNSPHWMVWTHTTIMLILMLPVITTGLSRYQIKDCPSDNPIEPELFCYKQH